MTPTDMDWLRHVGKLNRDAIAERNRADRWQQSCLVTWAVNVALSVWLWVELAR
jgi:hypothetical protein